MECSRELPSHKLPEIVGSPPVTETFPPFTEKASCVTPDGQHHSGGVHKQGSDIPLVEHAGMQTDSLEQKIFAVSEGHSCTVVQTPLPGASTFMQSGGFTWRKWAWFGNGMDVRAWTFL